MRKYPPYKFKGSVEVEGRNLVIRIPFNEPKESSGGWMILIASTKGFEETIVNGVKLRVMVQVGWSIKQDDLWKSDGTWNVAKVYRWYKKLTEQRKSKPTLNSYRER